MSIETKGQTAADNSYTDSATASRRMLQNQRAFQAYFRRRLGNPQDAEDAYQDFCLKVIRAAKSVQDDEKIDAWLGRTMRNTLIDHYRRRDTRQRAESAYAQEVQVTESAADEAPTHSPCKCIHKALPKLKPDYVAILRRADLAENPRSQIAADLGLTTNALNVRLHRARHALKKELERSCPACRAGSFLDCECG